MEPDDNTTIKISNKSLQYLYFILCKTPQTVLQPEMKNICEDSEINFSSEDFEGFFSESIFSLSNFFELIEDKVIEFETKKVDIIKKGKKTNQELQKEESMPEKITDDQEKRGMTPRDEKLIKKYKDELDKIDNKITDLGREEVSFEIEEGLLKEIYNLFAKTIYRPFELQNGKPGLSTSEEVLMIADILGKIDNY